MVARADITFEAMLPTEADALAFKECFDRNDQSKDLLTVRWHFIDNVLKSTKVLFAKAALFESMPKVIGAIYAVLPNRFFVSGNVVLGIQSLDTLTDLAFRRMGLFTDLADEMYRNCAQNGYKLVYGIPNKNSAHGFYTKLGWINLDPLPLLIKPLRLSYILRRLPYLRTLAHFLPDVRLQRPLFRRHLNLKGVQLVPIVRFDERADELWYSFRNATCKVAVERDKNYLNWRIFEKPNGGYSAVGLMSTDQSLLGYVIFKGSPRSGQGAGAIVELIFRPDLYQVGAVLLDYAVEKLAQLGCDAVLAMNFGHSINHDIFMNSGFLNVPPRFVPDELHFGARSFDHAYDAAIADRRNWYLSLCDSDTD